MVSISTGNRKKTYRSIAEASRATGIPYITLYQRLRMGLPLFAPVRPYGKSKKRKNNVVKLKLAA